MTKRKTNEEFIKEIYNLVGDEYLFLDVYRNALTKIKVRHNSEKCNNYTYEVKPNSFLNGSRCPKCSGLMKKTTDIFKEEIFQLVGNEYELIGEYKNNKTKVSVMHVNESCDNYTYEVAPEKFLFGRRCPRCAGKERKTTKSFKVEISKITGNEYSVIGEYVNNHTKIEIIHNKCKKSFKVKPNVFLNGCRCPHCNMTKGESKVFSVLENLGIKHEREYDKFNITGLNGGLLRFDFVFNLENEVYAIEYDGEYHYMKKHKNDGHEILVKHDEIKNNYCKENNIKLLRIPYWHYDKIENMIKDFIKR